MVCRHDFSPLLSPLPSPEEAVTRIRIPQGIVQGGLQCRIARRGRAGIQRLVRMARGSLKRQGAVEGW
ncbi:hypothetical protein Y88_0277 [Novosphingobium nitrogenifigens DSM 19370]|uniref:Uncharacterized protein n=1 Tax=Novosphingobium nitrogenifigens DSM 19370 TaxID=983920 RepID=F1ZAZ6_9SPHN|nr:hypothetical protein Y88_0277 [Novosphingobium nitrogenifigens DSM 19370]